MTIINKLKLNNIYEQAHNDYVPVLHLDTAEVLYNTVKSAQPSRILEVGTAVGVSGIVMLSAYDKSNLTTIEINTQRYNEAIKNFTSYRLLSRTQLILDDAFNVISGLEVKKKFDFIFLDGPKGQYVKYLPYLKKLLNVGGILFCDNINFKGLVNTNAIPARKIRTIVVNLRKFLKEITSDKDFDTQVLNVGDGVCIAKLIR